MRNTISIVPLEWFAPSIWGVHSHTLCISCTHKDCTQLPQVFFDIVDFVNVQVQRQRCLPGGGAGRQLWFFAKFLLVLE